MRVTRLAPSPTGALHLGNARTFLINHAHAQQAGCRVRLRVEDLDTPRVKPGADRGALDLLRWLGITWDDGPHYQAHDLTPYQAALDTLLAQSVAYPCAASRREVEAAASAPHAADHETRYPGLSRHRLGEPLPPLGADHADAVRVRVPDEVTTLQDAFAGPHTLSVQQHVGDFVVATKAGYPSYQLAVVVDDARQGVTDIVRGDDLLPSTHRQRWLQRWLGVTPPTTWHVPLVLGPDGRRLSKRHGDTRVETYRAAGTAPERVVGLLAWWCGVVPERVPMPVDAFTAGFAWDKLPARPVTFTADDDAWLRS